MRSWWVAPAVIAALLGVLLGGVLYLVRPLHLTASGASTAQAGPSSPTAAPSSVTSGSSSPTTRRSASPSARSSTSAPRRVPDGPDFTQRALLQSSEFIQYKWARADELSLTTGISAKPILRCLRPDQVAAKPVAAYAATHHGLTTLAGEQVIRYYSETDAEDAFEQLASGVSQCADAESSRRATVGKRHDPDLDGISQTRWWNLRGASENDKLRGVLVIMRVDDRLMALCLTSDSTDPAKTTDIIPLMRQGGLRMV